MTGDGLIHQEGHHRIDASLDEVEGQNTGQKQGIQNLRGHAHENRGNEMVGRQHHQGHGDGTADQAQDCALLGVSDPINSRSHQHQHGGGDDVHDDAIQTAGSADGKSLNHRSHHRQNDASHRAVSKGADEDGDVRRIILQEGYGRDQGHMDHGDQHNRDGHQDGHGHHLTNSFAHKKTLPIFLM